MLTYKDCIEDLLFTTKRLAPGEQGAPPHNRRCYFQKYVDKVAKKEVKEIFGVVVSKLLALRKTSSPRP